MKAIRDYITPSRIKEKKQAMPFLSRAKPENQYKPVKIDYTSVDVDIPPEFLARNVQEKQQSIDVATGEDAGKGAQTGQSGLAPTITRIDFSQTPLPEYKGLYAVILDNVLSPAECKEMLELAETSAAEQGWQPARINAGSGYEVLMPDYRNSDRIIWDSQEMVDRLWRRCLQCDPEGRLEKELARVNGESEDEEELAFGKAVIGREGQHWEFMHVNKRMRFLRYGPGQFFSSHCDSSYPDPDAGGLERTLFTLQLYLNDDGVKGGATTFWSGDKKRRYDVAPKLGRVLIFQHRRLYHSGDVVLKGRKYTVRSDIMYRMVSRDGQAIER